VRPERAADNSPPSRAAVMKQYNYISTHPLGHTGPVTGSLCLFLCSCLTQLILFDVRGVFTLLPKVQLHVSALYSSHLQVVHESLESSYTRFSMGCVQYRVFPMGNAFGAWL
jgi:hypothetical protein